MYVTLSLYLYLSLYISIYIYIHIHMYTYNTQPINEQHPRGRRGARQLRNAAIATRTSVLLFCVFTLNPKSYPLP